MGCASSSPAVAEPIGGANQAAPKSVASRTPAGATSAPAPIRASDSSTAESQTGSHGGNGKPPVHPDSSPSGTPTSATHGGADNVGMGQFDTSNLSSPANGHDGGAGGDSNNSVGSAYRPGYSSGASTPTESIDGSSHRGGTGSKSSKNPKQLLHSSSILGLDKMIEDRKGEGNLTNNVVHIEVPFGKPIEEVYDGVHDGPVLGSGISGLVRLITHKATKVKYAVKCLDLGLVETEEGLQQLREEIYIMCQLDHPNIVRLEEVYESHSEIYLVQELCLGGELFDRLDEQPDYHYTEAQCARLVKQMLCSVRYIHSKGIIHRDLKLENFLFSNTSADSELKMIDFGLSKHFKFGEVQHEAVGTLYTVAPEVIRGCYDERCDVWAIGVITFLLLSGDPPFGGCGGPEPLMQVRENILRGSYEFEPEDIWENVSEEAQNFIKALLVTDPNRRPTAREVQRSTWLRKWASRDRQHEDPKLNPNVIKSLVNFKEYSDMRKLLCEVLSFTLLPDQIADLRREFEKMDTDGSGEISLAGLKHVLMENAGAGSLGSLTEEEVEDIFNAMRVRKTETRIHWHEFIAAGLSHCQVDERNLKLAFDRLDSDHKGYVTFENIMDLMGNDASQSEDAMRRMWGDSMEACQNKDAHITYDDFLLLMKGQTRECARPGAVPVGMMPAMTSLSGGLGAGLGAGLGDLHTLHEVHAEDQSHSHEEASPDVDAVSGPSQDEVLVLPSGGVVSVADGAVTGLRSKATKRLSTGSGASGGGASKRGSIGEDRSSHRGSMGSASSRNQSSPGVSLTAPNTPLVYGKMGPDILEAPLSMDTDDDDDEKISEEADKKLRFRIMDENGMVSSVPNLGSEGVNGGDFTPPQTPTRGAVDFITPISQRDKLQSPASLQQDGTSSLPRLDRPGLSRRRSRSVDDQDRVEEDDASAPRLIGLLPADSSRAILMPEHLHNKPEVDTIIKDKTKTPLVVNRQLYRAHRQMRLAVLEASKRFEEQRAEMEIERLKAANPRPVPSAGLTMRHGHKKELSSESLQHIMMQNQQDEKKNLEKASRRSGRGRRSRKKTVSDMAGMLSSVPPEELIMDPTPSKADKAAADAKMKKEQFNESNHSDSMPAESSMPAATGLDRGVTDSAAYEAKQHYHLKPTTPGVFRRTVDPFSEMSGRIYGLKNMGSTENTGFGSGGVTGVETIRESVVGASQSARVIPSRPERQSIASSDSDVDVKNEKDGGGDGDGDATNSKDDVWPPPPPL